TITNLGGIGGTAFSPIINSPEVAILGLARSATRPVYKDGQFVPRLLMPLCLTYDHRVIDGAAGARFTTRLVQLFSDPIRLLMGSEASITRARRIESLDMPANPTARFSACAAMVTLVFCSCDKPTPSSAPTSSSPAKDQSAKPVQI